MKKTFIFLIFVFLMAGSDWVQAEKPGSDLVITSNIRDAEINLNGELQEQKTPAYLTNLPEGDYIIELVERFGKRLREEIFLSASKVTTLNLDFDLGQLTIASNLGIDSVFVNNILTGLTIDPGHPAVIEKLVKGDYNIRLIDRKYGVNIEDKIFFQADFDTVNMMSHLGAFTVTTNEDQVPIFINGRRTDQTTPFTFENMPVGVYEIMLKKGDKRMSKVYQLKPTRESKVFPIDAGLENMVIINFEKNHLWKYISAGVGVVGVSTLTYFLTRKEEAPGLGSFPVPPEN